MLSDRLGVSRARIDAPVLEDQINIARSGPNPYDKLANPAPCSRGPPQPQGTKARPHTNKALSRGYRTALKPGLQALAKD